MSRAHSLLTGTKLEVSNAANGAPSPPPSQNPHPPATPKVRPLRSVSMPSFIVRTESNVLKERRKKPDPPCVRCKGSGRVDCRSCEGKGRTNQRHLTVLPKGEWPKWCRTCGGSGLGCCPRCFGTGKYTRTLGFRIPEVESNNQYQNPEAPQVPEKGETQSF